MRTIGIIGGMSAESTAHYYARINASVRAELGGLNAAEILLWSVNFAEIAAMQSAGQWDEAGRRLADAARRLEAAGADVIILATNTMHKVADQIEAASNFDCDLGVRHAIAAGLRGDDALRRDT